MPMPENAEMKPRGEMPMRTPKEVMDTILDFARQNDNIRIVGMEGSRVNKNIPRDSFQDFDVTYFVTDPCELTGSDEWLERFGEILMMQKPEDMELYPPQEPGYSYLIIFEDGIKIDLTILEEPQISEYLEQDKLRTVLLDKTERGLMGIEPTDEEYWIRKPSTCSFDDCCNEFWMLTSYVVKGLCRNEILFAIDHLQLMRDELLRMLSWQVGTEYGFHFSVGKNYKFLGKYLPDTTWKRVLSTYRNDSCEAVWDALFLCHELFRQSACGLATQLGYAYPEYDAKMTQYTRRFASGVPARGSKQTGKDR